MNKEVYDEYVKILKSELVPALGCTEPICIAYCAAKAREALGEFPEHIKVETSGNMIKNVKGVTVPNSGEQMGIEVAATLGVVGGNSKSDLEVLSDITDEDRNKTKELVKNGFCDVNLVENVTNLYVKIIAIKGNHTSSVTISEHHTNISEITIDDEIIFKSETTGNRAGEVLKKELLNIDEILEFGKELNVDDVREVIDRQINYNSAIAEEGMKNNWGASVGKTIIETYGDNVKFRARAMAAAASDARMAGCSLPVVINSGSGNQGLTVSLPVIEFSKEYNISHDDLIRALAVANLVSIHEKKNIGSLSAYCGAVSAGCAAAVGITFMLDKSEDIIKKTIVNTICAVGGIVCDGAKSSCAAKISAAVEAGIIGYNMAKRGRVYKSGEGLVQDSIEDTIKAVAHMARVGMKPTDIDILNIMIGKTKL